MTDFNMLYEKLPQNKKDTIQVLRKRMALDLSINVRDKIPFELYLMCANLPPMETFTFEGKTYTNTFLIKARSIRIINTIDPSINLQ